MLQATIKKKDELNYYDGVVVGHNNDGTYRIAYDDGDSWDSVPLNYVELRQNSVPQGIQEYYNVYFN